jgi:hypothetical protein
MAKKINNKGNWKDTSISWSIAEAIVGKDASHTATRRVQLKVAYPLMFVVWALSVYLGFLALIHALYTPTECVYKECHCYEGYDIWGNPIESPYVEDFCCTVHGHNCPENN